MTREQQVALDAMRQAWPEEVVQRMLAVATPVERMLDTSTATHPEDVANETQSIAASHLVIDAFFWEHREKFVQLALTYADAAAEEKFHALREAFWGGDVVPFSPPETHAATSTHQPPGETP